MTDCSKHKNPLIHNGTSQAQRLLPGLDKNQYARVDEKEFAGWIVFANNFAAFVNYYNNSNVTAGNWQPFFSNDVSALLGTIAIQNISRYRLDIKERFNFIRDDENKASLNQIRIKLEELFSAILTLSKSLDNYVKKLPVETSLKQTINNLIRTQLSFSLKRLIAYYKAAEDDGLIDHNIGHEWIILNLPLIDAAEIIDGEGLSELWYGNSTFSNWIDYKNDISPDNSIFKNPLDDPTKPADEREYLNIEHAANHNLFTGIFDSFLANFTKVINEAEKELLKTLESYDKHTPHYALFLSFLMLFRFTQQHINTFTQRHLDFYYKEVLKLQPRAAEANKVHILVELAKQVEKYLLAQGTLLKAGKDSLKKDVSYQLDNDSVFNKAKVAQLKTVYKAASVEKTLDEDNNETDNTGRIFASPFVNSDNGIDSELTSANKEWHPFVNKIYDDGRLQRIAMPKAQIGLAIASHYLYLTEGERKVFVRFVLNDITAFNGRKLECYLTSEKEWFKIDGFSINSSGKKLSDGLTNCSELSFIIPGSAPAIVNYNAEKHGGAFNVALPVLKIYLVNSNDTVYEYDDLKDVTITKVEIRVEVGMEDAGYNQKGMKNLQLSGDYGILDASKPFMPFGVQPTAGNRLVIGNKEIFSKKNVSLKLNLEWKDLPANRADISFADLGSANYPNIAIKNLEGGIWKTFKSYDEIFSNDGTSGVADTKQIVFSESSFNNSVTSFTEEYSSYNLNSSKGFIALQLTQSFGHKEYLVTYADYLVRKANNISTDDISMPIEPYTPMLQSLYTSYSAYCINDLTDSSLAGFNSREINFFHIYPFGDGELHKYLNTSENIYLLPQFKHAGETDSHIGEFYIGIKNLQPNESVNLLFQVMEGTTDPLVVKPSEHINWAVLSNNNWIEFESSEYSDNTLQLIQSGIISFKIPAEATSKSTILPAGYIWLRAAITKAAEAICKIISVDAQAAVATFLNNGNAPDFLNTTLPAGTVSKLHIPDAAIKKIIQPYSSFGGRPTEDEGHFYIRVSERLRHKARAITVWDYEHLVLEAFPEIYKVKCLNHTHTDDGIYHEVRPGHVSIITIPSLQNRNDVNPLKPYTQQSTLTNIENYLNKRISCFVKLHACQPQFEEVKLEFSVKFIDQYNDFNFYKKMLQEEITQFLSPWAYGNKSSIDFGGNVYKSVLINFIEERYYVDFITDVKMKVIVGEIPTASDDMDEIIASTARSILVSVPASQHVINEIIESDVVIDEVCIDKK
jgi:hypothetical protein